MSAIATATETVPAAKKLTRLYARGEYVQIRNLLYAVAHVAVARNRKVMAVSSP